MKRAIKFGGSGNSTARDLNAWLTNHPGVELVGIRPLMDSDRFIDLFCIVDIPESVDTSGWSDNVLEYLGMKKEESGGKDTGDTGVIETAGTRETQRS